MTLLKLLRKCRDRTGHVVQALKHRKIYKRRCHSLGWAREGGGSRFDAQPLSADPDKAATMLPWRNMHVPVASASTATATAALPDPAGVCALLVDHGLIMLIGVVNLGNDECAAARALRHALARWLSTAPMVCSQTRDAVAANPAYAAVIFYERTRLSLAAGCTDAPSCFFDGLPRSLPMFGAPVAMQFPESRMRNLEWQDVLNERLYTATKLDHFESGSVKLNELSHQFDHLEDISTEVPQRVRIFVSRTRSMCEGMRACKPAHWFRQCAHMQCNRLFMGKIPKPDPNVPVVVHSCHDHVDGHLYWKAIAPLPNYSEDPLRFCSRACAGQWWAQINGALAHTVDLGKRGSYLPQLHGQPTDKLVTSARQPTARAEFDLAIKRNGQLQSAITKLHKRRKQLAPAVARLDIDREVYARVRRANVDLGVLHATVKAISIKRWHAQQLFPGGSWDWRDNGFGEVAERARRIYDEVPNSGGPIHDLLKQHPFLNACKSRTRLVLQIR